MYKKNTVLTSPLAVSVDLQYVSARSTSYTLNCHAHSWYLAFIQDPVLTDQSLIYSLLINGTGIYSEAAFVWANTVVTQAILIVPQHLTLVWINNPLHLIDSVWSLHQIFRRIKILFKINLGKSRPPGFLFLTSPGSDMCMYMRYVGNLTMSPW